MLTYKFTITVDQTKCWKYKDQREKLYLQLQMSDVLVSARNFFEKMMTMGNKAGSNVEFRDNFTRGFDENEFIFKLQEMGVNISPEDSHKWFSILDLGKDG